MSIFRFFSVVLICLTIAGTVTAQVSFTTTASATKIGKNDILEVSYEAGNGNIENFIDPLFKSWQLIGGPNVSSSTFITNGKKTTSMSYQFVLKPLSVGTLVVPGTTAVIDGKQVTSRPITVKVTKNNTELDNTSQNNSNIPDPFSLLQPDTQTPEEIYENNDGYLLKDGEDILAKTKKNLFVMVDVSKKICYPGEAIRAVYQLYSRVNLDAHITKRPSFNGFSSIDLPDLNHSEYDIIKHNGKDFKVYPIRSVQLYPLLTGVQTLQPVEIETTIQYQKIPSAASVLPYNPYSPNNLINYPFTAKSDPVPVTVLPFPEAGKPAAFQGVTGHFEINATTEQNQLALSEAGILRLEVKGSGNWAMVQQPTINWPKGVDVFEPVVSENLDSQAIPLTGKRVYEYPYSTSKPGKLLIPAISIHYFDPEKKQYETSSTQPITIEILNQSKQVNKIPENDYGGLSGIDNTQIFTDIVVIAFPIAAVLLLLWLLIKNRRKNEFNRQELLYRKQYDARAKMHEEALLIKQEHASLKGYQPVITYNNFTGNTIANASDRNEILIEKITMVNEHAGIPATTAKSYFSIVKKDLQQLLLQHFKLSDQPQPITKQSLLENGFNAEEVNKIIDILELCERHIYSPFTEDFDKPKCNDMVSEITSIVRSRVKR